MQPPEFVSIGNDRTGTRYITAGFIALAIAPLACLSQSASNVISPSLPTSPASISSQEPQQSKSLESPEHGPQLEALLAAVSSDNLMRHVESLSGIHSRHVNSQTIGDAASLIYNSFQAAGGDWQVQYDEFPLAYNGVQTMQRNVVATLPGDAGASIVLVGAHYDSRTVDLTDSISRAPGADDNATGVAALLEMARVLGSSDARPQSTVVLVAFSAEEMGTHGSLHYIRLAQERGHDVQAVLVLDIIGNAAGPDGEGAIRAFSAPPVESSSRHLARYIEVIAQTYLPDFDVQLQESIDRPGRYSDHIPFVNSGVPGVRLIESVEDTTYQHSEFDLPERISPVYLRQATQLAMATVVNLAYGPPMPVMPNILPGQPDTLGWPPTESAAGYLLVLRPQSTSERTQLVRITNPDSTSLTMPSLSQGPFAAVSLAVVDAAGLTGMLSKELVLQPQ